MSNTPQCSLFSQVTSQRRRSWSPATSVRCGSTSPPTATPDWVRQSPGLRRGRSTPRSVSQSSGLLTFLTFLTWFQITNELQQMFDYRQEYHIASDQANPTTTTSTTTTSTMTSTTRTETTSTSAASTLERSLMIVFFSFLFLGH